MSYFVPYIDESGYHYPTYTDVLTAIVEDMQRIYGAGIYLGMDSPEYQMLAQIAQYVNELASKPAVSNFSISRISQ